MFKRLKEYLKSSTKSIRTTGPPTGMMRATKISITTGMGKAARKTTFMEIMAGTIPVRIGTHAAGKMVVAAARIIATAA